MIRSLFLSLIIFFLGSCVAPGTTFEELDQTQIDEAIAIIKNTELDVPVEDVSKMLRLNERIASVDSPFGSDGEKVLLDVLPDEKNDGPESDLQTNDIKNNIVHWLNELNPKQREVLARRFGLMGYEAATLEDVGMEIGLTRERVRQIQVEALKRLRDILSQQDLSIEALFQA